MYVHEPELATAVRVTKVSLVNCPEMTIKRTGPVGLLALGDPFRSTVYGSQQAAASAPATNKNRAIEESTRNPFRLAPTHSRTHARKIHARTRGPATIDINCR